MKISKWVWALIFISIIGTAAIYPMLPEQIPVHWNVNGDVDRYGGKTSALFTAVLPVLLALLLIYLPKIDPKKEAYSKHKKAYEIFLHVLIALFVMLHWITLLVAFGYSVNVGMYVGVAVGILFIIIGNHMGQIRHNYFFGIKTPWTLASEKVWTQTHRVGRWFFILQGILFVIAGFIRNEATIKLAAFFVFLTLVILYAYSYLVYRKLEK